MADRVARVRWRLRMMPVRVGEPARHPHALSRTTDALDPRCRMGRTHFRKLDIGYDPLDSARGADERALERERELADIGELSPYVVERADPTQTNVKVYRVILIQ